MQLEQTIAPLMVHATTATESLVVHVMLDSLAMELIAMMLTNVRMEIIVVTTMLLGPTI